MTKFIPVVAATALLAIGTYASAAQPSLSKRICKDAVTYLAEHGLVADNSSLYVRGSAPDDGWQLATKTFVFGVGTEVVAAPKTKVVDFAYFLKRDAGPGAVSAKISVMQTADEQRAKRQASNEVEIYRPAIRRGENRCERRGRPEIDRTVRVNQYIDFHDPLAGGLNSDLEDFHFSYPRDESGCEATNAKTYLDSFQFKNVERTQGDSFISRNFSFIGTAYAVGHKYSLLRSELHYHPASESTFCIGFSVPLNASASASLTVTELGLNGNWLPYSISWNIRR